jgi:hypothetical protein
MWRERDSTDDRTYEAAARVVFAYLDGRRWKKVDRWTEGEFKNKRLKSFVVADDGEVWAGFQHGDGTGFRYDDPTTLSRLVDGSWEEVVGGEVRGSKIVGPDGTVWVVDDAVLRGDDPARADAADGPLLRRLDGGEWQVWDVGDGIPTAEDWLWVAGTGVSPDGALWLEPSHLLIGEDCSPMVLADGLVRFDGTTADHFLRGYGIDGLDFGPDGSVWALAALDDGPRQIYVIRPEALGS